MDDEAEPRYRVTKWLRQQGWQTHEAISGMHAMEIWRELNPRPSLVVTDLRMESFNSGLTLSEAIKTEAPETVVVVMSGFITGLENRPPKFRYISKPLDFEELRQLIDET